MGLRSLSLLFLGIGWLIVWLGYHGSEQGILKVELLVACGLGI